MKMTWNKRMTWGFAAAAAAVAIPLTAGSASAAKWYDIASGPAVYSSLAECQADIPEAKQHYQDATCTDVNGKITLWALH